MKLQIPDFYLPIFDKFSELIQKADSILISSHVSPDGDNIGSQLALSGYLASLEKNYTIINTDELPTDFRFLPGNERFHTYASFEDQFPDFDLVIVLDSGELSRIGVVQELAQNKTVVNIDHHNTNAKFGHLNLVDSSSSSVGEMLFYYFTYIHFNFPVEVAEALYVSIATDTGYFKYEKTRPVVHQIVARLLDKGVNPAEINRLLNQTKPAVYVKVMGLILSRLTLVQDDKIAYAWIDYETLKELDMPSTEGIIDLLGIIDSVSVYFLVKEKEKGIYNMSLRSKLNIDVAVVAQAFGGGGHSKAAGCRSSELKRDEFIQKVISEVSKQL